MPYPDDTFDAIWCANTSQYLTDEELATALREFRRVVRPGGIVAIKEFDGTLPSIVPAPPLFLVHICESWYAKFGGGMGCRRTPALASWLRRAGLLQVRQHRVLAERSAPLGRFERQFWGDWLGFCAKSIPDLDVPAADRVLWEQLADPAGLARLLDDPDLNCSEGHIVAVGRVPDVA